MSTNTELFVITPTLVVNHTGIGIQFMPFPVKSEIQAKFLEESFTSSRRCEREEIDAVLGQLETGLEGLNRIWNSI